MTEGGRKERHEEGARNNGEESGVTGEGTGNDRDDLVALAGQGITREDTGMMVKVGRKGK